MSAEHLTDRLRGIYTVPVNDGAGLLNGSDTFTRHFETPPIQHEAADYIEQLRAQVRALEGPIAVCGPYKVDGKIHGGCGKPIVRGDEYRCLDCDAVMHKDCLRRHCSADEKDALILQLQQAVDTRTTQMGTVAQRALAAERERDALRANLHTACNYATQLAREVIDEAKARWSWPDVHPANTRRYELDISTAEQYRAWRVTVKAGDDTPSPEGPETGVGDA